jgi:pilus assembly protein Flp/PilA
MLHKLYKFLKQSEGATAIEYALIASLIAVVAIAGMKLIGNTINNKMYTISNALTNS